MTTSLVHDLLRGLPPMIDAATRCGLLDRTHAHAATAREHADALSLSPFAVELVLDVFVALGLVEKDASGRYASRVADGPKGALPWSHVGEFLTTGRPLTMLDHGDRTRGETYAGVVAWLSDQFTPAARVLAERLGPAKRILDVGAGSGIWSLTMANQAGVDAVIGLDLPEVTPRYLARATQMGLADRASAISGSYFVVAPDAPVDRVVIASVLHLETPENVASLVARAASWVAPGGEIVIVDCIGGATFERKLLASMYALHLGLRTERGRVHSVDLLRGACESAGFSDTNVFTLDPTPGLGALVARRGPHAT